VKRCQDFGLPQMCIALNHHHFRSIRFHPVKIDHAPVNRLLKTKVTYVAL